MSKTLPPIDVVLISHVHGDHFSPAPTIEFLRAHKNVHLFAPRQVVDALIAAGIGDDDPLLQQVRSVDLSPTDAAETIAFGSLEIDVVSIPHAGNRPTIQNYAWRVALDDAYSALHLGDAGPTRAAFEQHRAHFDRKANNLVLAPYWFIGHRNGDWILSEILDAENVIGVHVPEIDPESVLDRSSGGDFFLNPGEARVFDATKAD